MGMPSLNPSCKWWWWTHTSSCFIGASHSVIILIATRDENRGREEGENRIEKKDKRNWIARERKRKA